MPTHTVTHKGVGGTEDNDILNAFPICSFAGTLNVFRN